MAGWGRMERAGGDGEGNDDEDAEPAKKDKVLGFSSRELGENPEKGTGWVLVLVAVWMWGALLLSPTTGRSPRPSSTGA